MQKRSSKIHTPRLSQYFQNRKPSSVRMAQILFENRKDKVDAVNGAIGNVTLPMHPKMAKRMRELAGSKSPFKDNVVPYSSTRGLTETNEAFLRVLEASDINTKGLYTQIIDGASTGMELVIVGTTDPESQGGRPVLLLDPSYANYVSMAERTERKIVTSARILSDYGNFSLPDFESLERLIKKEKPSTLIVIPYDNPTGNYLNQKDLGCLAELAVKYNMWLVSDEAYRELYYGEQKVASIWKVSEREVPGISGRRISIETASKVWNACGLRIGALVTDNKEWNEKAIATYTANLCANVIGQYIFGALAHEKKTDLKKWFDKQRKYYKNIISEVSAEIKREIPGIIVSAPEAAIYSVVDFRNIVPLDFDAREFVKFCAEKGKVKISGKDYTLLTAPMNGFYKVENGTRNPGQYQVRLAYVETPERIKMIPVLLKELLGAYLGNKTFRYPVPATML